MIKVISLSGGKDSTAMALLQIESNVDDDLRFLFCDTGNEHQITYDYLTYLNSVIKEKGYSGIEYLKANFTERLYKKRDNLLSQEKTEWQADRLQSAIDNLKPSHNPFLDLCLFKSRFPSSLARFCTQELKLEPTKEYIGNVLATGEDCQNLVGIRADESIQRARMEATQLFMRNDETGAECWTIRPILDYTADDCFDVLRRHNVEPNPLYKMGFKRVGCMPCINCTKAELKEIATRFPSEIYRIEAWEKQVSNSCKRGSSTFFPDVGGGQNRIWEKVSWSKGNSCNMQDLFDDFSDCRSMYGLCE